MIPNNISPRGDRVAGCYCGQAIYPARAGWRHVATGDARCNTTGAAR